MPVAFFCFFAAILAGLSGMALGVYMGIAQDFSLAPAHAHANLLGWVTLGLYGLYHRGAANAGGGLAWSQAGCGALGGALMSGGLGVYLTTGDGRFEALVIVGALLAIAGMMLFFAVVVRDAAASAARRNPPEAEIKPAGPEKRRAPQHRSPA